MKMAGNRLGLLARTPSVDQEWIVSGNGEGALDDQIKKTE